MSLRSVILRQFQIPHKLNDIGICRRTLLLMRGLSNAESRRYLRGRSITGSDFNQMTERQMEEYDDTMEFPSNKEFLKKYKIKNPEPSAEEPSQEWSHDNRIPNSKKFQRSPNIYERAKQNYPDYNYDFDDGGFVQKRRDNYDSRNRFNNNFNNDYDSRKRFNNDPRRRFNNDFNRDRDFDFDEEKSNNRYANRDERQLNRNNNKYQNNYRENDRFNDRNNDGYNRNRQFQNNNYNNNRSERYNDDRQFQRNKQFHFDDGDGRPRFSKIREYERKQKTFNHEEESDKFMQKEDTEESVNAETEDIDDEKVKRKSEPIPYNITAENRFEVLNQIMCPLHFHRYEKQISIKQKKNMQILQKFAHSLKRIDSPVVRDDRGMPCPLELVKPSPIIDHYRNKDEFSVWPGYDGVSKTVGFFIGEPSKHHNVVCVEPEQIRITKNSHKELAKKFQNYLREVSPYDYCQNYGDGGNWRRFVVRSNDLGQHMVITIMHPQQLTEEELQEEMNRVKNYFDGDERITSLYFQAAPHTRCTHEQAPYRHLFGDTHVKEMLFDMQFLISPDSFFQINRQGAEVLYRNVISEINPNKNTTVLDICCGTGTLACLISPDVSRVIGIDANASAVNDAKRNAELNNVKNVTFLSGSVEEKLPQLMDDLYSQQLVVVANPTRAGLHASVIHTLREIKHITKLVYVSCKPEDYAMKNFIHLCMSPTKNSPKLGAPFVPINAIPVDLFPHTNHCELIVTFERFE